MHTYTDDETHASLVHTFPDLTQWTTEKLLSEHANLAVTLCLAHRAGEPDDEILQDLQGVSGELNRRSFEHDTHACDLRRIGIDQLAWLAVLLKVPLATVVGAISAIPQDSEPEL